VFADPFLAKASTFLLPAILLCPGTHCVLPGISGLLAFPDQLTPGLMPH
jgi:hypothetical protein